MLAAREAAAVGEVYVSADGSDWRDISSPVHAIEVEDHEYLTDQATIAIDDPTGVLAHASYEGLELRVTLGWGDAKQAIFEGVVVRSRSLTRPRGSQVELTALDFSYRMRRRTPDPPMIWHGGETLVEVVTAIASRTDYGIAVKQVEPLADVAFTDANPLTQANVSDLDFVQELADRYRCRAFVEFDGEDASEFFFVPIEKLAQAEPVVTLDRDAGSLIAFDYGRLSAVAAVAVRAASLDPATGRLVEHEPAPAPPLPAGPAAAPERDRDLSGSQRDALQTLTELAAAATAKIEVDTRRTTAVHADPAAAAAGVLRDPTRIAGLRGSGVAGGTVMLRAKSRVTIAGIAPWAEGDWYLTRVNHVYSRQRSSYVCRFKVTR